MPFDAQSEIVVLVTISPDGGPKMRIAASLMAEELMGHEALPVTLAAPAYSTFAYAILVEALGTARSQIPFQSPAPGVGSAEVNTMGAAAVPTATSAPVAGAVPSNWSMRICPPLLNRIVTPASMTSVASGFPVGPPVTHRSPADAEWPTRYGTPSWCSVTVPFDTPSPTAPAVLQPIADKMMTSEPLPV